MDIDIPTEYMKLKLKELLDCPFRDFNTKYEDLKRRKGVYAIYEGDAIIYIGESGDLNERLFTNLLWGDEKSHTLRAKLLGYKGIETKEDIKNFLLKKCRFKVIESTFRKRLQDFACGVLNPLFYGSKRIKSLR